MGNHSGSRAFLKSVPSGSVESGEVHATGCDFDFCAGDIGGRGFGAFGDGHAIDQYGVSFPGTELDHVVWQWPKTVQRDVGREGYRNPAPGSRDLCGLSSFGHPHPFRTRGGLTRGGMEGNRNRAFHLCFHVEGDRVLLAHLAYNGCGNDIVVLDNFQRLLPDSRVIYQDVGFIEIVPVEQTPFEGAVAEKILRGSLEGGIEGEKNGKVPHNQTVLFQGDV